MKKFFAILLSGLMMPAMAGTIRHDYPDQAYRDFGQSSSFDSVGAIIGETDGGYYGCSGTAISRHWMLTAAHCVQDAKSMSFYLTDHEGGYDAYQASSWTANQNFSSANLLAGWDVGLVYFQQVLDVAPAKIYQQRDEEGMIGAIVGFGSSGDGVTGTQTEFGYKRAGLNVMSFAFSLEGDGQQILFGDFDPPADNNPNNALDLFEDGYAIPFEYSPSFGDSGGGMFVYANNQFYLAGVNSFISDANGNNLDADYGDLFGLTRVTSLSGWIKEKTGQVPEPTSGALLLLPLLGLMARRFRQS